MMTEEELRRILREELRLVVREELQQLRAELLQRQIAGGEWLGTSDLAARLGITTKEFSNWCRGRDALKPFKRNRNGRREWLAPMVERLRAAEAD